MGNLSRALGMPTEPHRAGLGTAERVPSPSLGAAKTSFSQGQGLREVREGLCQAAEGWTQHPRDLSQHRSLQPSPAAVLWAEDTNYSEREVQSTP